MVAGCPEPTSALLPDCAGQGFTRLQDRVDRSNHGADLHRDLIVIDLDGGLLEGHQVEDEDVDQSSLCIVSAGKEPDGPSDCSGAHQLEHVSPVGRIGRQPGDGIEFLGIHQILLLTA